MAAPPILRDFFPEEAITARRRFRMRTFNNCLFVLGIFVPGCILFSRLPAHDVLELLLGAGLFFLFFFVWQDRTIWLFCDSCHKPIATNTPWQCGFCHKENTQTTRFPFVGECEHCHAEPKAYKCHYDDCGQLAFLTADKMKEHFAMCVGSPVKQDSVSDEEQQRKEKLAKAHALEMANLDEKLEAFRERKEALKKLPPTEAIRADYEKGHAMFLGVDEFYDERLKQIKEEFKDNPDRLERELSYLNKWRLKRTPQ
ncbi:MAG TPA: hypothetical protein VFE51_08455 [Verrucomicrobiae bacterium]|nr:hypothetical protein [Verrucomicrobiae bacterium]